MSRLQRLLLLAALCLTSCQGEEGSDICSTENVVDDVEGASAQKAPGNTGKTLRPPAQSTGTPSKAGVSEAQ